MYLSAEHGRRSPLPTVVLLLVIAVLLDRYLVTYLCPWISSMGGISLKIVFLDIPLALPQLDPLPVAILFSLFYSMLPGPSASRQEAAPAGRLSTIWGGIIFLAIWMAAGALAYHFIQVFLPREVRNGIDSFGMHVDIYTPIPGYYMLQLRGGVVLLACFIMGGRTLVKRINRTAMIIPQSPAPVGQPSVESSPIVQSAVPVGSPTIQSSSAPAKPSPAIAVTPAPQPRRTRVTTRSVAIVAPRRVEVLHRDNATRY